MSGWSTLASVPFMLLALTPGQTGWALGAVLGGGILLSMPVGPVNNTIVEVVPANLRATAVAASTVCLHLLGDALSRWMIGALSDATSLATALLIAPLAVAAGGASWLLAAGR